MRRESNREGPEVHLLFYFSWGEGRAREAECRELCSVILTFSSQRPVWRQNSPVKLGVRQVQAFNWTSLSPSLSLVTDIHDIPPHAYRYRDPPGLHTDEAIRLSEDVRRDEMVVMCGQWGQWGRSDWPLPTCSSGCVTTWLLPGYPHREQANNQK